MKKIMLFLFLILIAIVYLVYTYIQNKDVETYNIFGTYILSSQINPDSSNVGTEYLTLSEDKKASYEKFYIYAQKTTERTGTWNYKNDTLTITYQMERLYLLDKKETSIGEFTYPKKDTLIIRSEPFSIKYIVGKDKSETRICPIGTGQCFERYLTEIIE